MEMNVGKNQQLKQRSKNYEIITSLKKPDRHRETFPGNRRRNQKRK